MSDKQSKNTVECKSKTWQKMASHDVVFSQFMQLAQPALLGTLVKMISLAEAEEVSQEAFVKFYFICVEQTQVSQELSDFNALKPLLYSIAKNLAISRLRHQKVVDNYAQSMILANCKEPRSKKYDAEIELMQSDEKVQLQHAIDSLPPMCRQVFIQRKILNKPHKQIAKTLNITVKTVENHISKGLKLCRQYFLKLDKDFEPNKNTDSQHKTQPLTKNAQHSENRKKVI